jgi:glycosyltransferase involved in cell wall biosynthesis
VRAVAPITPEADTGGDAFASAHPELGIRRFRVPSFEIATGRPPAAEYRLREGAALGAAAAALVRARRPDLVLIGRESFAWHVPQLARAWARPCVLLARGNPTRLILDGVYPRAQARRFLAQFRAVDLVVTVATHLARGLRRAGVRRVLTIPNAVDLEAFRPRPRPAGLARALGVPGDALVVLHASNLTPLKRPLDLLRAVARLRSRLPDLVCLVVGDGPLRPALETEARRLGLRDVLRFTGWMAHERMPEVMGLADLVAMPSAAEGLARVYLEAQACARVLVASDIPAAREVITDGMTGLLFPVGNDAALAAALLRAAGDARLRAAIGRRARARVARHHGIDRAVSSYERVLARVADRARAGAPRR